MKPKAKDILWKGIIEDLFADFLRFFYAYADELTYNCSGPERKRSPIRFKANDYMQQFLFCFRPG
jgi:hypothetical protein